MTTLVTGAAGFIGAHVCRALLARGERVHGVDSFSDYYPVALKRDRVAALCPDLPLTEVDLADRDAASALFASVKPTRVIHLAAQAGVRHSLSAPHEYADANLVGFLNGPRWRIWSTPPPPRFTAAGCSRRFAKISASIARFRCMPPPRPQMS
jgi:UDP-glucuronate 4-epimerase